MKDNSIVNRITCYSARRSVEPGRPRSAHPDIRRACVEALECRRLLSFSAALAYPVGAIAEDVLTADFNGDGRLDLAVANYGDSTVGVLLGNADGTFQPQQTSATGIWPMSLAVGDFNADGKLDLTSVSAGNATVSVLLGNGNGTFEAATLGYTGSATSVAVGDFNADGKLDLGVTSNLGYAYYGSVSFYGVVAVLLGNGDGSFTAPQDTWLLGDGQHTSAVAAEGHTRAATAREPSMPTMMRTAPARGAAPAGGRRARSTARASALAATRSRAPADPAPSAPATRRGSGRARPQGSRARRRASQANCPAEPPPAQAPRARPRPTARPDRQIEPRRQQVMTAPALWTCEMRDGGKLEQQTFGVFGFAGSVGGAQGDTFVDRPWNVLIDAPRIQDGRSQPGGNERRDEDRDLGGGVVGGTRERRSRDEQRHRETDAAECARADQLTPGIGVRLHGNAAPHGEPRACGEDGLEGARGEIEAAGRTVIGCRPTSPTAHRVSSEFTAP